MKNILLVLILVFLTSCELDGWFDKEWKDDRDDFNVIDKIWDQSLDKVIKLFDTRSRAS